MSRGECGREARKKALSSPLGGYSAPSSAAGKSKAVRRPSPDRVTRIISSQVWTGAPPDDLLKIVARGEGSRHQRAKTLPEVDVAPPPQIDERGGVRFLVDRKALDRLAALRGPGEGYSDVIVRAAKP